MPQEKLSRCILHTQWNIEDKKCDRAGELIKDAELELGKLCKEAGCEDADELVEAENHSTQRRNLTRQIDEMQSQLAVWTGGRITEFSAEAALEPVDTLVSRIDTLRRRK